MNIGFDAKRVTHNTTGLGNYSRFIINTLSTHYPDHLYNLFTPDRGNIPLENLLKHNVILKYPQFFLHKTFKSLWRSKYIIRDLKHNQISLFHGLSNELPIGIEKSGIPSVVTIHDLIFIRYPQFYKPIDRKIYYNKFKAACQKSDKIIAVSEMTKKDIISFFAIPENKIEVIYQGCNPIFHEKITEESLICFRKKYTLPKEFILNIGSIEARKNALLIVKALKRVKSDIPLIILGRRTPYADSIDQYIKENNLSHKVRILSGVTTDELPSFYQSASLFIYPSLFEGFGIPIIEALHSETPVIATTDSCLEEAGGTSSIYINPNDDAQFAHEIDNVLSDKSLRDKMVIDGKAYVKKFDNKVVATRIMSLYNSLLK